MPTWGHWYWPLGMAVTLLLFLPAELFAVFTNVGNTLSYYAWTQLHVGLAYANNMDSVGWYSSLILWLLFVVIITAHIWWRQI